MNPTIKIYVNKEDLIVMMAALTGNTDEQVAEAWGRCWATMATTNSEAIRLHDLITKKSKEMKADV